MSPDQVHIEFHPADGSFVIDARPADLDPLLAMLMAYATRINGEPTSDPKRAQRRLGSHLSADREPAIVSFERAVSSDR